MAAGSGELTSDELLEQWRAKQANRLDFTMEQKDEFAEAFMNFADEEGNLDIPALGELLEALGEDLTPDDVEIMFNEVDEDGSGEVDFDEFIEMMRKRLLTAQDAEIDIRSAFELLDKNGNGSIDKEEIFNVVCEFCGKLTPDEVMELILWCDINHDGELDFDEFHDIMKQETVAERQQARFLEEAESC